MGRVLGIVYRALSAQLIQKAGFTRKRAQTGAVTLIQRFGSALNLNVHFHMLFLDGVYTITPWGKSRFHRTNAPDQRELTELVHTISQRVAGFLERKLAMGVQLSTLYLSHHGLVNKQSDTSVTYSISEYGKSLLDSPEVKQRFHKSFERELIPLSV
jgi:hypothetical protein